MKQFVFFIVFGIYTLFVNGQTIVYENYQISLPNGIMKPIFKQKLEECLAENIPSMTELRKIGENHTKDLVLKIFCRCENDSLIKLYIELDYHFPKNSILTNSCYISLNGYSCLWFGDETELIKLDNNKIKKLQYHDKYTLSSQDSLHIVENEEPNAIMEMTYNIKHNVFSVGSVVVPKTYDDIVYQRIAKIDNNKNKIFKNEDVDIPVSIKNGNSSIREYLVNRCHQEIKHMSFDVNLKFVIDEDGKICDWHRIRVYSYGLPQNIKSKIHNIIENIPLCTPAYRKGKNVRSYYDMNIRINQW